MFAAYTVGLLALIGTLNADYSVKVTMLNFEVPDGKLMNGKACDNKLFFWKGFEQCDLAFEVCLGSTHTENAKDLTKCQGKWQDFGMVTFDNNKAIFASQKYKEFVNPSSVTYIGENAGLVIKVRVYDQDFFGKHQMVDQMLIVVDPSDMTFGKPTALSIDNNRATKVVTDVAKTSINVQYEATCTSGKAPSCKETKVAPSKCVHGAMVFGRCVCFPFSGYTGADCSTPKKAPVKPVGVKPAPVDDPVPAPGPAKVPPGKVPFGPGPLAPHDIPDNAPMGPGPLAPHPGMPNPGHGPMVPGNQPEQPEDPLGPIWPGHGSFARRLPIAPGPVVPKGGIAPMPVNDPRPFGPKPGVAQPAPKPLGPIWPGMGNNQ